MKRGLGIFGKVFLYTLIYLAVVIGATVGFFAQQFTQAVVAGRDRRFADDMRELTAKVGGVPDIYEIIAELDDYRSRNDSFEFSLRTGDGDVFYETSGFPGELFPPSIGTHLGVVGAAPVGSPPDGNTEMITASRNFAIILENGLYLCVYNNVSHESVYLSYISAILAVLTVFVALSVAGAYFFARLISDPIKRLAAETAKMRDLDYKPEPFERRDEIGKLADNVYDVYATLKRELGRVREMEESRQYFFSAASHELKTPLAAAGALIEEMLEGIVETENYPEYHRKCMKLIYEQNKLINEILEISKLTDSRMQPGVEKVGLIGALDSALPPHRTLAESYGATIVVDITEDVTFFADRAMFGRSLSNILMNAVQNTPAGGEVRIWVEPRGESMIRLNILNTGARIDAEELKLLFEPFYRTDKSRGRSQNRSGLGLAIVSKALDLMDIPFALENTDEGVLFWMELEKCD